jgi:hypothetical protein
MSDEEQIGENEKRALLFEQMAAQIRLNEGAKFGGAFLVIPPADGEPFSSLMLNQDEASIFWGAVKTLAEVAMQALDIASRQQGFQRR